MSEADGREDFALGHGEQFVRDRAEAEAELAAGKTYALEDVVKDSETDEAIAWQKGYEQGHQDREEEVERLRDEVFELKIYRGFGLDHGHEGCVAEIKRLKKLAQEALNEGHPTG